MARNIPRAPKGIKQKSRKFWKRVTLSIAALCLFPCPLPSKHESNRPWLSITQNLCCYCDEQRLTLSLTPQSQEIMRLSQFLERQVTCTCLAPRALLGSGQGTKYRRYVLKIGMGRHKATKGNLPRKVYEITRDIIKMCSGRITRG